MGKQTTNWDKVQGNWRAARGAFRMKWAKLSDDDLEAALAGRANLVGTVVFHYGEPREKLEAEVDALVAYL